MRRSKTVKPGRIRVVLENEHGGRLILQILEDNSGGATIEQGEQFTHLNFGGDRFRDLLEWMDDAPCRYIKTGTTYCWETE